MHVVIDPRLHAGHTQHTQPWRRFGMFNTSSAPPVPKTTPWVSWSMENAPKHSVSGSQYADLFADTYGLALLLWPGHLGSGSVLSKHRPQARAVVVILRLAHLCSTSLSSTPGPQQFAIHQLTLAMVTGYRG